MRKTINVMATSLNRCATLNDGILMMDYNGICPCTNALKEHIRACIESDKFSNTAFHMASYFS